MEGDNTLSSSVNISTDLFDSYEQDFIELANNIKENTDVIKNPDSEEDRKTLVRKVAKQLEMADSCIRNMEMELRSNNITDRKRLKTLRDNLQEYKSEYNELKQEFNFVKRNLEKYDKQKLMGEDDSIEEDMRGYGGKNSAQIALESKRLLDSSSESIERSLRMVQQLESQGGEILGELGEQKEQIHNTRKKLGEVEDGIRQSGSILRRMEWRNLYNKIILVVIILILIAFIVIFLIIQLR
jgi:vesicle transport through interaction with t-SNAREs protein 1